MNAHGNEYIIDTSITATEPPPAGDQPFDQDEMEQIGNLYRIPWHVRQQAADASEDVFGYRWPYALRALPDGVVLRVDNLYLTLPPRTRMMYLTIEGQEARRVYWEARGNQHALELDPIPTVYIPMDYDAFMYMHRRITNGFQQIDLQRYFLYNDLVPALDPEP